MAYSEEAKFEWDDTKNAENIEKHGVSFELARELFVSGVEYLEIFDESHSVDKDRFIAIGPILAGVVLVIWTERDEGVTRIISARWATRGEQILYRERMEKEQ